MAGAIATAFVDIRPNAAGFAAEAQTQIQKGVEQVKSTGLVSVDAQFQGLRDSIAETKAEASDFMRSLQGIQPGAGLGDITAEIDILIAQARQLQGIGEIDFAGGKLHSAQVLLKDLGDAAPTESWQRFEAANRSLENALVDTNARARNVAEGFTELDQGAGRASAGFSLLKVGLVGLAFTAGFQALQELREGLKATGDEAFTSEGRIRNFAASLLSLDVVGAFRALHDEEARLAPDLEKALATLQQMREEASRVSIKDVVNDTAKFRAEVDRAGESWELVRLRQAASGELVASQLRGMVGMVGTGRTIADLEAEAAKNSEDFANKLRMAALNAVQLEHALGGIAAIMPNLVQQIDEAVREGQARIDEATAAKGQLPSGFQAAIAREEGPEGSESGLLKVLRAADEKLAKQIEDLRSQKFPTPKTSAALAAAQRQRNSIEDQIAAILEGDDDPAKARRAFQLPTRFTEAALAADITATLTDDLNVAKRTEKFLRDLLAQTKQGTDKYREVLSLLQSAQTERLSLEKQIAGDRESFLREQNQAMLDALGLKEQTLQNRLLEAQLTPTNADNLRVLEKLRVLYFNASKNLQLAADVRLGFEAKKLQIRAQILALKGQDTGFTLEQLFAEAVKEAQEFGSNIGPAGSILSPQAARGELARDILEQGTIAHPKEVSDALAQAGIDVQTEILSESQRQTGVLDGILAAIQGGGADTVEGGARGKVGAGTGAALGIAFARNAGRFMHGT